MAAAAVRPSSMSPASSICLERLALCAQIPAKQSACKFLPDRELVGALLGAALARRMHLLGDAEQVLDVMSDFVGDDVGLGEIARCTEPLRQHAVEIEVDVDLPVPGAIERPDRRARPAARGLHRARRTARASARRTGCCPAGRCRPRCPPCRPAPPRRSPSGDPGPGPSVPPAAGPATPPSCPAFSRISRRVDAEEHRDERDHDDSDAAAGNATGNAHAAPVFDIVTASARFPAHGQDLRFPRVRGLASVSIGVGNRRPMRHHEQTVARIDAGRQPADHVDPVEQRPHPNSTAETLAQVGLLHLAHGIARQVVHDEHALGNLEAGQLRLQRGDERRPHRGSHALAATTTATTASPKSGCGTPMTADSTTPGTASSTSSISFGYTL